MVYCWMVSWPEVKEMFPGDLEMGSIVASPVEDHFHDIRYQKHLLRARNPPVALRFFPKSCAILEVLLRISLKSFF